MILTPNPEIIYAAQRRPELRRVLERADLSLPDGVGVVWASRILGAPVPERVTGVDMMESILHLCQEETHKVFFLGTKPGIIEEAVIQASRQWPSLRVAGWHHGFFPLEEGGEIAREIQDSGASVLFVGMGADREMTWLDRHLDELGVKVAMGVGGSLDVLAGFTRRAPDWVRAANLEWLYRLYREPRRFGRMLVLPRFAGLVLLRALEGARVPFVRKGERE